MGKVGTDSFHVEASFAKKSKERAVGIVAVERHGFAAWLEREPAHVRAWVESTAFRAIAMETEGEGRGRRIAFKLDSGDAVFLGRDHPLRMIEGEHGPSPRILVRHGLEAELSRPVYYELAQLAISEGGDPPGIWSDGTFFSLEDQ